jgi:SAM-dependent methyltransferase
MLLVDAAEQKAMGKIASASGFSVTSCSTQARMPGRAFLALFCIFLFATAFCVAQTNDLPHYETRAEHDPNGLGKFYMGREIAQVMGHQAADWLERPEREQEERPDLVLPTLKIKAGETVADIGAGTGYYTRRLAKIVGEKGLVYAVDIQQEMLDLLTNRMASAKINNVKPILGDLTDPKLPPASMDLAIMVDVYHEFDHPYEMAQSLCRALKPGGRLVFVEFRGEDPNVPIKTVHKMTEAQVKKEMAVQPLDWVETIEALPWQHIIVFKKRR